ncbi:hypothetical protein VBM87_01885 [Mycoplasma sp. 744]|uniref:MAG3090 family protein n=1 Tax=Mycoplasma sp. 744 TaxID=3108531 RepID=UPI002B1E2AD8|nr:hypothetical protein [Mycoplasma sp. 744]MEA4115529.1 hypothetical protein [Mycoplasma sp. 744]
MKRLICYFEPKQDSTYPWLLKHPKLKNGLAKFKTRSEAIKWYMLLKFETSIWFHNDNKIFGGQLTIDNEENDWNNYIKIKGFDGGETYEGLCQEFGISPTTFQVNYDHLKSETQELDFVLLHDPNNYFPPELEIAKKSRKEMVDLEQVNQLKAKYEEQINNLQQELENKENTTEYIIKENKPGYTVVYKEFAKLEINKKLDSLALYLTKLRQLDKILEVQNISKEDYLRISQNFDHLNHNVTTITNFENEEIKELIFKVHKLIIKVQESILSKLKIDDNLANLPEFFAYYYNEEKEQKISLAYETSFVLVGLEHIGFVKENLYDYPVDYIIDPSKYGVAIINDLNELVKEVSDVVQEQNIAETVSKETPKEFSPTVNTLFMPEFWTGKQQTTDIEYITKTQLVLDDTNRKEVSKTRKIVKYILLLVAIGITIGIILGILQLAGVYNFY